MLIDHYQFGKIRIAGVEYDEDLIILRGEVHPSWWRKAGGHVFAPQDLGRIIGSAPAVVCLGIGSLGRVRVLEETVSGFIMSGTRVMIDRTGRIVDEYNRLAKGGVDVAAALHLTC